MNRTLASVLAASFLLVPLAAADGGDTHPDCSDGQRFITYSENGDSLAESSPVFVCEGEHWDGQDPISDADSPDSITNCADAAGLNQADGSQTVYFCQDANPNDSGADPLALKPVSFRVSTDGSSAVYVALHIGFVGQAIVYTDGEIAAVYLRDSTPINALATVVSSAGVTRGYVSESDCSDQHYQNAANSNPPRRDPDDPLACGRDNTAITAVLP